MVLTSIGRAQLEESPEGLRVAVPSKWDWLNFLWQLALSSLVLLLAWQDSHSEPVTIAMILVVLGLLIVRSWLWDLFGYETIHVTHDLLSSRYSMFGIGWTFRYRLSGVSNFRYGAPIRSRYGTENRTVVFDYEFLPRRFGLYLSEAEAGQLIAIIQAWVNSSDSAASLPKASIPSPV
jgi:hypothetical protein